jgi:hypothetical protein
MQIQEIRMSYEVPPTLSRRAFPKTLPRELKETIVKRVLTAETVREHHGRE